MKLLHLFLVFICVPIYISGQNNKEQNLKKQQVSLFAGLANSGNDVHSWGKDGLGVLHNISFAAGIYYRYSLNDDFGLRLNHSWTKLIGNDKELVELPSHPVRAYTFETNLHEFSVLLEWNFLNSLIKTPATASEVYVSDNENPSVKEFKRYYLPYLIGGVGVSFTNPVVDWTPKPRPARNKKDEENVEKTNLQIPYGAGIRYFISHELVLGLELRSILPLNDYIDGISYSANPDKNDSYIFLGFSVGYKF